MFSLLLKNGFFSPPYGVIVPVLDGGHLIASCFVFRGIQKALCVMISQARGLCFYQSSHLESPLLNKVSGASVCDAGNQYRR